VSDFDFSPAGIRTKCGEKFFRGETFGDAIAEQSRRGFIGDNGATISAHHLASEFASLRH
jgi:hypothetical protein